MRTTRRYLALELSKSIALVTFALLGLFTFFSIIDELDQLGKNNYVLYHLLWLELLALPNRFYDLLPISLLIGTTLGLANLAQRHELVILRVSGVSSFKLLKHLCIGLLPIVLIACFVAEIVTPKAETALQEARLFYKGSLGGSQQLRSGMWFKEKTDQGLIRIINIARLTSNTELSDITLYEFKNHQLQFFIQSPSALFSNGSLTLTAPLVYDFRKIQTQTVSEQNTAALQLSRPATLKLNTQITPTVLLNKSIAPERMNLLNLLNYIDFLEDNKLVSDRETIALWRKLSYPLTLFIMIAIATPIAFLQTRRGGVGIKMFTGIILGVTFFMTNQLSLNYGLLSKWPAWLTAILPSLIVLVFATFALWYVDHKNKFLRLTKQ